MNKSIAVFEDNLIRDLFAEKLDLSIIDFTDVRFYSNREKVYGDISPEGCDIIFTDESKSNNKLDNFVKRIMSINSDARIIVVLKKEDAYKARCLFRLGVYDCIVKNELSSDYLYELFLDREYQSVNGNEIKSRHEVLRELFWGNGSIPGNFSSIYKINKDCVYVVTMYMVSFFDSVKGEGFREKANTICEAISQYLRNLGVGECFYNHHSQIVLLFSPSDEVDIDFVARETKKIMSIIRSTFKFKIFTVLDREIYKFAEIHETWQERIENTKYYFLCEKNIAYIEDLNNKYTEDFNAYERIRTFQQALNDFDKKAFDREIVNILDIKPKPADLKNLMDFFLTLFNEIKKLEIQYDVAFADDHKIKMILRRGTLKQAAGYCQECVNKIMEGISESSRMSIHIKKYLENHIAENVTLKDLSENFNFEYNYSSKYFNKIMGMSFKKYFTNLRLEVAKNLLKTTKHKCYEIAVMCGYKNYEHFSRMFYKKYKIWPKQIK